ncbi:adenosylcobinamide-GDP ribazoletransferase [Tessaracoccus sp. G1721]
MRGVVAALGLFTVIPVPPVAEIDRALAGRAMAAFPWVGLLVGSLAGAVLWGVVALGAGGLLGAALALAVVALLTGALHLDGLADTADGLGSRKPAADALVIMRKSDIGPMGVAALVLALLVDAAALGSLSEAGGGAAAGALAVAAMVGRAVVTLATVPTASARQSGFGALFIGSTSRMTAVLTGAAVLAVSAGVGALVDGVPGAAVFAGAAAVAGAIGSLWAAHVRRRLAGMTGDVFGSIVEVAQTAFLVLAALCAGALRV